jgi:hypothetical protein
VARSGEAMPKSIISISFFGLGREAEHLIAPFLHTFVAML